MSRQPEGKFAIFGHQKMRVAQLVEHMAQSKRRFESGSALPNHPSVDWAEVASASQLALPFGGNQHCVLFGGAAVTGGRWVVAKMENAYRRDKVDTSKRFTWSQRSHEFNHAWFDSTPIHYGSGGIDGHVPVKAEMPIVDAK